MSDPLDAPSTPQAMLNPTPTTSQVARNLSTSFATSSSNLVQSVVRVYQVPLQRSSTPKTQVLAQPQQTTLVTTVNTSQKTTKSQLCNKFKTSQA